MYNRLADTLPQFIQEATPEAPTPPSAPLALCVTVPLYYNLEKGHPESNLILLCPVCL